MRLQTETGWPLTRADSVRVCLSFHCYSEGSRGLNHFLCGPSAQRHAVFLLALEPIASFITCSRIPNEISRQSRRPVRAVQVSYSQWIATTVHGLGMSVGLKNALGLLEQLEPMYDWFLNEQCNGASPPSPPGHSTGC